jgi:hypothetical protein
MDLTLARPSDNIGPALRGRAHVRAFDCIRHVCGHLRDCRDVDADGGVIAETACAQLANRGVYAQPGPVGADPGHLNINRRVNGSR